MEGFTRDVELAPPLISQPQYAYTDHGFGTNGNAETMHSILYNFPPLISECYAPAVSVDTINNHRDLVPGFAITNSSSGTELIYRLSSSCGFSPPIYHGNSQGFSCEETVDESSFSLPTATTSMNSSKGLKQPSEAQYEDTIGPNVDGMITQLLRHDCPYMPSEGPLSVVCSESECVTQPYSTYDDQEIVGSEQLLSHLLYEETATYPAKDSMPLYEAELSAHVAPSIPLVNARNQGRHHQDIVVSSAPFSQRDGSNSKPCKKPSTLLPPLKSSEKLHCLFAFAGCESKCKDRNEWKRHLKTMHLLSRSYTCYECPEKSFGRKEHFTQHFVRTHVSASERKASEAKRASPEFKKMLEHKQAAAYGDETIFPPKAPRCWIQGCEADFAGDSTAWEKCLDHVSRHVKALVAGKESFRYYAFTSDLVAYFYEIGAITKDGLDCWILGAQSNREQSQKNKKKIKRRPADDDDDGSPKTRKRQKKR
ncbi:hypothetical protein E4U13_003729 [Claviceps humidiphila]|uniref:C2H2-type domain-containing protein n=1 Tax=Claviceps humidiphila TaxID=1294629 RepID=A0A9P7Q029_9HYPO|nr:hypothetical protein E4U13_003729 [Claviceps humidiphila]